MKKRVVLSGYFGFKNFGDEAILSVLINKLKEDKHRITVISSDPQYTKSQYKHIRSVQTFNIPDIFAAIRKSDVLISGGGSLLQDVTSIKSLFYYQFIIFLGLLLQKDVIIFAQGIGPINNKFGQFATKILLKSCKYISVRDEKSLELLKNWDIKADLLCDPIFSTKIPKCKKSNTVAVQLRDFHTMNEDFIDRLAQKICKDFSDKEIEIYSFQDAIDLQVCEKFQKAVNLLNPSIKTTIYSNLTNDEIITRLAGAEYMVAMRFHAIIVGLLAKCKILAINYDIKVEKLAKEFGLPIIDLKREFSNQFTELKNQNSETIYPKVQTKKFDWNGFNHILN